MDEQQHLTDRLVVATEEQDVLWVLVSFTEMRELGCLDQAIKAAHSWKGYSALEAISRLANFSLLHSFIAEMLLLEGARISSMAMSSINSKLVTLLESWEKGGRDQAHVAQLLLSLDIAEAADWIDANLPLPPDPERLTGGGPLPLAPRLSTTTLSGNSTLHTPPSSPTFEPLLLESRSSQPSRKEESVFSPVPSSSSSNLVRHDCSSDDVSRNPISPETQQQNFLSYPSPRRSTSPIRTGPNLEPTSVRLHLSKLPNHYTSYQLVTLFADIDVRARDVRIRSVNQTRFIGFASVPARDADHCIASLNKKIVAGHMIYCSFAKEASRAPPLPPKQSVSPLLPAKPVFDSRPSTSQVHHRTSAPSRRSLSPRRIPPESRRSRSPSRQRTQEVVERNDSNAEGMEEGEILDDTTSHTTPLSSTAAPSQPLPSPSDRPLTQLRLSGLPRRFDNRPLIAKLFEDSDIAAHSITVPGVASNRPTRSALVVISTPEVDRCREIFDGRIMEGSTVSCFLTRYQPHRLLSPINPSPPPCQ